MSQQRSEEWYEMRLGRFTASRISEILGVQGLGLTGEGYAFDKACEIVFGEDEDDRFVSFDMQRGIDLEPMAFRKFKELKSMDFIDVEEAFFFPYKDYGGASPDGVYFESCLEIKCPKAKKFFKLVAQGEKAIDKKYIDQMQFQMLCSNSKQCSFFNYIIFKGQEMWHEIIVKRDEIRIKFIEERLPIAVKKRDEYVKLLQTKKQF